MDKIPYELQKQVYGVGWFGYPYGQVGKALEDPRLSKKCFNTWKGIMTRCYNPKSLEKHPTYTGCSVDQEWHCYKNFVKWFEENYYEIKGERMELDKDILCKGNKVYSPENCVFVPKRINMIFSKTKKGNTSEPIGVLYRDDIDKYTAKCNNVLEKRNVYIGLYDNEIDAFIAYKSYKKAYIKRIADHYMADIPNRLYDAMCRYEIDMYH